jgi:hypothetical protein
MTMMHRNPARMLDARAQALKAERKRAFTEGCWLGLCAGCFGTLGAFFLFFQLGA